MGLTFTSDARPPSNTQLLPNRFLRPAFGELYGFDADADSGVTIDGALTTELAEPLTAENGDILQFEPVGGAPAAFPNTYSVELDGSNDYIDCGGASDFGFTDGAGNDDPFSISAWVKLDSASIQRIVDKSGTTQASRSYLFGTDGDSKLSIFLGPGTGNYLYIRENTALSTGTWHHIVATYDGSNAGGGLTLYRAGSVVTSSNLSSGSYAGLPSTSETLKIGRLNLNGSVMNGLVDEVAVFDYELTSSQVSTIYNSGSPADISSLNPLGWWRMGDDDSGTGTTITDQGSGGNDGTLINGPTFSTTVPS